MTDTDHRPQLRAVDAGTEVRLDESAGPAPAYVDLTRAEPQRRAIIPEHWRTLEAAKRHVQLAAAGTATGPRTTGYGRPGTPPSRPGTRSAACSPSRPPSCGGGTSRARPSSSTRPPRTGC